MKTREKYRRSGGFCLAAACLLLVLAVPHSIGRAAEKVSGTTDLLEKKMMAASTKTILYKKGKTKNAYSPSWGRAKKLSLKAKKLTIGKKGWYSFLVKTKKGGRNVFSIRLPAKVYPILCNTSVKLKNGYYDIIPKKNKAQAAAVKNASLDKGAAVSLSRRGDSACGCWKLEAAGGRNFRLKNVNSGLYLSDTAGGDKAGNAVQAKGSAKKKTQVFKAYSAGGGYTYIRCLGTKKYLHVNGNALEFTDRRPNKAWKLRFEETSCPASLVTVSGGTYPSAIQEGAAFVLEGTVHSRYTMKTLTVRILDGAGRAVLAKSVNPRGCSYDIKKIDAAITFGRLQAGKYRYCIAVTDMTGRETVWVDQPFSVIPRMTMMGPPAAVGSRTLTYNSDLIRAVGHQSEGGALEKKACASYALAYCNAILFNSAPSPHSYWISNTDVSCVWSKGGYVCDPLGYGSETAVLQAAYDQLAAGRPCILHVTGSTDQHWLCLIGYRDVSVRQALTADNFIAIDPWDGAVITVSAKYSVKNTYRLAVKS